MRELSLNILDLVENSLKAGAKLVNITVAINLNTLTIIIEDDGSGMSAEFIKKVVDPFITTRTTRKVGMGIPLIKMAAEAAGGQFVIESKEGVGTKVTATFKLDHIDRAPLGALEDTIVTLLANGQDADIVLKYEFNDKEFIFDTREIKEHLADIPIYNSEILQFIKGLIKENIISINKGEVI